MTIIVMSSPPGRGIAATIGAIDAAGDEESLREGIDRAHVATVAELRAHTPAAALAAAWSEVLAHAVAAAVRVNDGGSAPWAWYVSGSVGRGEAAPGSDVETMVALDDAVSEEAKGDLMRRAADIHAMLERCGVHGDANGVLAGRSRFCRRRASWSDGLHRWCVHPREDRGVVMTGLAADSLPLRHRHDIFVGESSGGPDPMRADTRREFLANYPARQAMLQDATAVRAAFPSRLKILASGSDSVDVKLAAIDPVVKIARWGGLSAGCESGSTLARLDAAVAADVVEAEDGSSLRDTFEWLLRFRWRTGAAAWPAAGRVSDVVVLSEMAPQERAMLRSVAREIAGISRKLSYLASASSFR